MTSREKNRIKLLSRNYWVAAVFGELKVCEFFIALLHVRLINCSSSLGGAAFFLLFFWFATNLGPVAIYNNIWLLHVWHFHNDRLIILLKRTQRHKSKAKLNSDSLNRLARCKRHFARPCTQLTLMNEEKTHTHTNSVEITMREASVRMK